ncbi:MAG: hypothetical protein AAF705_19710 [Bacteroidota bacterium]
MRKRFEQQMQLGVEPIAEVDLTMKSRDEFPHLLAGLQYIFTKPELNTQIFELLEKSILSGKKRTGRMGMSLWEIFVLGTVRLNLDIDYDRLHYMANSDAKLQGILGIRIIEPLISSVKEYQLQTIKDNVGLLDEETMHAINVLIVKAGHQLKKKKRKKKKNLPWI